MTIAPTRCGCSGWWSRRSGRRWRARPGRDRHQVGARALDRHVSDDDQRVGADPAAALDVRAGADRDRVTGAAAKIAFCIDVYAAGGTVRAVVVHRERRARTRLRKAIETRQRRQHGSTNPRPSRRDQLPSTPLDLEPLRPRDGLRSRSRRGNAPGVEMSQRARRSSARSCARCPRSVVRGLIVHSRATRAPVEDRRARRGVASATAGTHHRVGLLVVVRRRGGSRRSPSVAGETTSQPSRSRSSARRARRARSRGRSPP